MANEKYISSIKLDNVKYNVKQKDAALLSDIYEDANGDLTQYEIFSKPADLEKDVQFYIYSNSYSSSNSGEVTLEVNEIMSFDIEGNGSYAIVKINGTEVYNISTDGTTKSIEPIYVQYLTFDAQFSSVDLINFQVKKPKFLLKNQYASYVDNIEDDALDNLSNYYSVGSFDWSSGFDYNPTNHTFGGDNYNVTFSANNKPYHIVIDLNNDHGSFDVSYNGQSWNSAQSPIVDITTDGTHNVVLSYYMATSIKITTFEILNGKTYESGIITGQKKEEYDNAAPIAYVDTQVSGANAYTDTQLANKADKNHTHVIVGGMTDYDLSSYGFIKQNNAWHISKTYPDSLSLSLFAAGNTISMKATPTGADGNIILNGTTYGEWETETTVDFTGQLTAPLQINCGNTAMGGEITITELKVLTSEGFLDITNKLKYDEYDTRITSIETSMGDIDTALDDIIALQNSYINGGASS